MLPRKKAVELLSTVLEVENLKAVILAAGKGARMGPFTVSEPKVMIRVANKPIMEHVVTALVENSVREIVVVVGYRLERIMSYFEDGRRFGAKIEYVQQLKQLGTAHALFEARDKLKGRFLVLNGSNLIDAKAVSELLDQEPPALLITESEEPAKYGVVIEHDNYLESIVEKPSELISNLINTGMYALDGDFFSEGEKLIRAGNYDIPSIIQTIVAARRVKAVRTTGTWTDALYPWDLLRMNSVALADIGEGRAGRIEKDVHFKGKVMVGDGSTIRSGTYIEGPVVIGEGCDIGPQAVIRPATSIGKNVQIGPFSDVENCLLMDDVSIEGGSIVANSVVGTGATIGPRMTTLRGAAGIEIEGEYHKVEDIGALIGDDAEIAGGAVLEPGTIIGAKCRIGPMARLRGSLQNGSIVV